MSPDFHERARRLIDQERVEGLAAGDREWLGLHLKNCAECARMAEATDGALRSLRVLSVPLPPALAYRTQLRVYLRAQVRQRRRGGWMAWTACGISWAVGLASAPYVWRGYEWLGHYAGVPSLVWKTGFALWWAAPALLAAGALLLERADAEEH